MKEDGMRKIGGKQGQDSVRRGKRNEIDSGGAVSRRMALLLIPLGCVECS